MKKILRIACGLLLSSLVIGACGCEKGGNSENGGDNNATAAVTSNPTEEPTPEITEIPVPTRDPADTRKTANIVLLIGQSNAVGVAHNQYLEKKIPSKDYRRAKTGYNNVKILYWAEAGGAEGEKNTYLTNMKTIPEEGDMTIGNVFKNVKLGQAWRSFIFGPEVGIAKYLSDNHADEEFYIVKVAKGSVAIGDSWLEGQYCYEKMVSFMDVAVKTLEKENLRPELAAVCFMQGENEATEEKAAEEYYESLSDLVKRIRTKYNDISAPGGIRFIDAGIMEMRPFAKKINETKAKFADESNLNYYFSTVEMGLHTDQEPEGNVDIDHYDAESMWQLGQKFGEYICD